ncbi:cytochrome P450 [Roridomyces roridus]|uniref:Cytochrome P450 n=1 Tax=Roridomyces roridus TaxID=1738132 RepID=A0AAD7CGG9_9AGAR|nr:cytochrome P450 [Roridomyces roridus]
MPTRLDSFAAVVAAATLLFLYVRNRRARSPLANIPGPSPVSSWKGNLPQIFNIKGWDFPSYIFATYGRVAKMHGLFGREVLYVSDPRVVRRVLLNFPPPPMVVESHNLVNGSGLLGTMGDQHKKQRKMLNPLFAVKHVKAFTPLFFDMAQKLRDTYLNELGIAEEPRTMNMHYWSSRLTLELISQAAFGQSLDPLNSEDSAHPYTVAVRAMLPAALPLSVFRLTTPYLKYLGPKSLRRWLVHALPWPALNEMGKVVDVIYSTAVSTYKQKKTIDLDDPSHKDVMSVLLNANKRASQEDRLPENEVISQMGTLTAAAHDTTPNALARIFWHLGQDQRVQDKLREEILSAKLDINNPDIVQLYDELMALPYLDAVLRETLRLTSPVSMLQRRANVDTSIPLWKPIIGVDGSDITTLNVTKGTDFILVIVNAHRDPEIWGPDALEFKPERWLNPLPDAVGDAALPGVYFQLLPFGGGFKACIGYKYAELQMKVMLYTLLSAFKFQPTTDKVIWNMHMVATPSVEGVKGSQLPMKVSAIV